MSGATVFYSVIRPHRFVPFRSRQVGLGRRRLLRWEVVRETRPQTFAAPRGGLTVWSGWEHHSLHWTGKAAFREAQRAQKVWRAARGGGE